MGSQRMTAWAIVGLQYRINPITTNPI
jgi:hypothetical protein